MANLTRKQLRDLVRDLVGEPDHANLRDGVMDQMINNSLSKVQIDLIALGLKTFTKQTALEGNVVATPSDMLAIPNAIIEVKGASGTQGGSSLVMTGAGATMSVSQLAIGASQEWTITFSTGTAVAITQFNASARTMTITYISATTTLAELVTFLTSNVLWRSYFNVPTTTGTTSGVVTITGAQAIASGTGTGFYPAEEVTIEDFSRQEYNTYLVPTETNIVYVRTGNYNGDTVIQFLPRTVKWAYLYYHYRLPAITSDDTAHGIPNEYEDLLITDLCIRCYARLRYSEGLGQKIAEYDRKLTMAKTDYMELTAQKVAEKTRLTAEKPND